MTKVILVRHGETDWNHAKRYQGHSDIPLNQTGIHQARRLGERLAQENIQAVFSSDLTRALETAKYIADNHNLPVLAHQGFREIHFGRWEGLTYAQIMADSPEQLQAIYQGDINLCMPEGESFRKVAERALAAMTECTTAYQEETIVVVAHGGTLRTILCKALGLNLSELWSINQDHTAISLIEYEDGREKVSLLNDSGHWGDHGNRD